MGLLGHYIKLTDGPRHASEVHGVLLQHFHKCTSFSNKTLRFCLVSSLCSREYLYVRIRPNSAWCSVSVKTIICGDGLVGPNTSLAVIVW